MTCSGHGTCVNGECVCDRLYSGEICQNKGIALLTCEHFLRNMLQMSVRMLVIAVVTAFALIFSPLPTPPSSATAVLGGLDNTVQNVSN